LAEIPRPELLHFQDNEPIDIECGKENATPDLSAFEALARCVFLKALWIVSAKQKQRELSERLHPDIKVFLNLDYAP
jgi:hypothetical protein